MKSHVLSFILISMLFSSLCLAQSQAEGNELCAEYCSQVMGEEGVCTFRNQKNYDERIAIYPDLNTCMDTCATFPADGEEDADAGDSVQCRISHAELAQGDEGPEKHCPHAAPGGGGVCINRGPCEAYCVFYYDRVQEEECPALTELGGPDDIGFMNRKDFVFYPGPKCMSTCANFAGAGLAWEMSGNSANCRQQFYLMAHHRIEDTNEDAIERKNLCNNARPFESEMCQGSLFGDYFKTTEPDPCKELCYNDSLTCHEYGPTEQCMETCRDFPAVGERRSTSGDTVQCRLSWMQYAFFMEGEDREQYCAFGAQDSPVCVDRDPDNPDTKQPLTESMKKIKMSH